MMKKSSRRIEVSASDLKNGWHDYLDRVAQGRQELVVTRYGRPIATLAPYVDTTSTATFFGHMRGSVAVHGNIVDPLDASWEADA